jgi:hypothetical protein
MYLRNQVYHKSLEKTPYELWHNNKPDILHLREFGVLVWILLKGQKKPLKLQPHSKQFYYVGCKDGSKLVLYYSPKTRKVLISLGTFVSSISLQKKYPPKKLLLIFYTIN